MTIKTIISSLKQDAIELNKPRFQFWFVDEPQFATYDRRGRFAHMLKCYRARPDLYHVRKLDTHLYSVRVRGSDAIAHIGS